MAVFFVFDNMQTLRESTWNSKCRLKQMKTTTAIPPKHNCINNKEANQIRMTWSNQNWCQFHQHFTRVFFVQKFCAKFFCTYILGLIFFRRKNISANAHIKCWWNWPLFSRWHLDAKWFCFCSCFPTFVQRSISPKFCNSFGYFWRQLLNC